MSTTDDDTGDGGTGDAWSNAQVIEGQGHECPECGESFKSLPGLATHRKLKHGVESARGRGERSRGSRDRSPRRSSGDGGEQRVQRRQRQVRETLEEFTELARELRGDTGEQPGSLAEVIRRDADKIATSLSWVAEKFTPIGFAIDKLTGHGGILTVARGFNGVIVHGLRSWRVMLARRAEAEQLAQMGLYPTGEEPDLDAADEPPPGAFPS